jgi:hypothetical protein
MARSALSLEGKIILGAALATLFVLAFGLRLTGEAAHELIGAAAFIPLAAHLAA